MHPIAKLKILTDSTKSYKEFLHKKLNSDPSAIGDWIDRHFISKQDANKIINIEIRAIAFEKAASEVLGELIQSGDFDKAIIFLDEFTKFKNPNILSAEIQMYLKALELNKDDIRDMIEDCDDDKEKVVGIFNNLRAAKQELDNTEVKEELSEKISNDFRKLETLLDFFLLDRVIEEANVATGGDNDLLLKSPGDDIPFL
jgi:tetratricopeptide (TPR) repeat protein